MLQHAGVVLVLVVEKLDSAEFQLLHNRNVALRLSNRAEQNVISWKASSSQLGTLATTDHKCDKHSALKYF